MKFRPWTALVVVLFLALAAIDYFVASSRWLVLLTPFCLVAGVVLKWEIDSHKSEAELREEHYDSERDLVDFYVALCVAVLSVAVGLYYHAGWWTAVTFLASEGTLVAGFKLCKLVDQESARIAEQRSATRPAAAG